MRGLEFENQEGEMPLFEVAILEIPTEDEAKKGKAERLVFGPKPVVAKDGNSASIASVLQNKEEIGEIDFAKIQVLVRPFG
jgi:hypothetical protein